MIERFMMRAAHPSKARPPLPGRTAVLLAALAPLALLSACWGEVEDAPPPTATATATSGAEGEGPDGVLATGGAREVSERTDLFIFEYSYPQAAGEVEELAAWLDTRLAQEREGLAAEATRDRREASANGFPFNTYSSSTEWKVVASLPDWISLSADLSSYQGGAHPNYAFDSIIWDRARGVALEPMAFFTSANALDDALGEQLCEALNTERARRRGGPVDPSSTDSFEACVPANDTNVILGSSDGVHFNRIGVQIAPYIAGPYAEGSYEFTFPVTPALLETVREDYRSAFAARTPG